VKILIDTTFARRGPSGTAVYVTHLVDALRDAGVEVVEAANERRREPGTGSKRNLAEDMRWTQVDLRQRAREHDVDVIHHPLPAHIARSGVAQVVTVHDVAFETFPDAFDPRFAAFARRAHLVAAKKADAVIAVSHATAAEVKQRWGVDAIVAHHGPGQALDVGARGDARHFLYVGDAEPRKDLPTLLAAHARYRSVTPDPLPLVLAGSALSLDSGVTSVERPTAAELADLHRHAKALVHPSRLEGFGLTVLEALHAGTPVIAADTPAIREITDGAATLVPPGDVDALVKALKDPPTTAHAPPFSWAESAQAHIRAYTLATGS
jgi:glycosyltransferase involved in cell wall biosynthesis